MINRDRKREYYKTLYIPSGQYLWYTCLSLEEAKRELDALIRHNDSLHWFPYTITYAEFEIIYDTTPLPPISSSGERTFA